MIKALTALDEGEASDPAAAVGPALGAEQLAILASAERTVSVEIDGLQMLATALKGALGLAVIEAIERIRAARGRIIVTGIGKSGHVCRKIAATLASTGTPAYFVHPSEASHGDLGMIAPEDVVIALSWSGESSELAAILAYSRRFKVPLIAVTAHAGSTLGASADIVLELPRVQEACPHGLAPTTSTLMQLAIGDILAIALLESRGFTAQDFKVFHPGGRLGASLRLVRDIMHKGEAIPLAPVGSLMKEAIVLISQKGFGCLGVVDARGKLVGIVTDGDLRRHLSDHLLTLPVEAVMTANPKTIRSDVLLASALEMLNSRSITSLMVVDADKPIGIIHLHDLLRAGVA